MSNGDDVLDNWEEIDEVRLNTSLHNTKTSSASSVACERITKSIHQSSNLGPVPTATAAATNTNLTSTFKPTTQMKLLQRSTTQDSTSSTTSNASTKALNTIDTPNKSPLDDMAAAFQPVMMVLHKPQDEYQSANYTAPIANQTVKILRRPTQSSEPRNNGIRPKQPIKTLQQREQEYAEARLRILGSAKNPEDDEQKGSNASPVSVTSSNTDSTPSTPSTPTISSPPAPTLANPSVPKTNSNKIPTAGSGGNGAANQFNNHYNQQFQQQLQQQQQQYQQQNYHQQQQNYYYQQQQQQQQPQSPAYNNNRTYNMNPLLGLGPMGAIGQPAQYQTTNLNSSQTQQQPPQQHLKYQQYQKSPQQQHKSLHQQQQQQLQQQQTWSPVVGGSVSSTSLRQQQNDTILRLPRGPDGTTGFQMRR